MTATTIDIEQRLTASEVADVLRCSKEKVYRMARAGDIPAEHVGRSYRFQLSAVTEALKANPTASLAQSRRSINSRRRA